MTDEQILATYDDPDKVWAIRRISDHKLMAHGLWDAAVSQFDYMYKNGEYYLDKLNKKPSGEGGS